MILLFLLSYEKVGNLGTFCKWDLVINSLFADDDNDENEMNCVDLRIVNPLYILMKRIYYYLFYIC